ncbi:unnamed protein product, partial [Cyprideis torosa]
GIKEQRCHRPLSSLAPVISPPRLDPGQGACAGCLESFEEIQRHAVTTLLPSVPGPIAPAAFDLRQGSLCARESEIVSLLQRESFHRGRVSTKMIKGGVCLQKIPRMRSVSEAAHRPVKGNIPLNDRSYLGNVAVQFKISQS